MKKQATFSEAIKVLEGTQKVLNGNVGIPTWEGIKGEFIINSEGKISGVRWEVGEWVGTFLLSDFSFSEYRKTSFSEDFKPLKGYEESNNKPAKAIVSLFSVLGALGLTSEDCP